MNRVNCSAFTFTDEFAQVDSPPCSDSVIALGFICGVNLFFNFFNLLMLLQRWKYVSGKQRLLMKNPAGGFGGYCLVRTPLLTSFYMVFTINFVIFLILALLDLVNLRNGWSVFTYCLIWLPILIYSQIYLKNYLKLGLKAIPLAKRILAANNTNSYSQSMNTNNDSKRNLFQTSNPVFSNSATNISSVNSADMTRTATTASASPIQSETRKESIIILKRKPVPLDERAPVSNLVWFSFHMSSLSIFVLAVITMIIVPIYPGQHTIISIAIVPVLVFLFFLVNGACLTSST